MNRITQLSIMTVLWALSVSFNTLCAQNKSYKGAEVYSLSQHEISYGRIEARIQAASGSGILSTLFTWKEGSEQSDVFWEEIDIEIFGKDNAESWQSNIITGLTSLQTSEQVHHHDISFANAYHTFIIEWTPVYVAWFVDNVELRRTIEGQVNVLSSPVGIRFSLWASTSASWAGPWDDSVLPQYQFVNWITYYSYHDNHFKWEWTDDFVTANVIVQDGKLVLCLTQAGETGYGGMVPADTGETAILYPNSEEVPHHLILKQNHPNPFNPFTMIHYNLPEESRVVIKIYNIVGQEKCKLVDRIEAAGAKSLLWNGHDRSGRELGSGVYICEVSAGRSVKCSKMILLR